MAALGSVGNGVSVDTVGEYGVRRTSVQRSLRVLLSYNPDAHFLFRDPGGEIQIVAKERTTLEEADELIHVHHWEQVPLSEAVAGLERGAETLSPEEKRELERLKRSAVRETIDRVRAEFQRKSSAISQGRSLPRGSFRSLLEKLARMDPHCLSPEESKESEGLKQEINDYRNKTRNLHFS